MGLSYLIHNAVKNIIIFGKIKFYALKLSL